MKSVRNICEQVINIRLRRILMTQYELPKDEILTHCFRNKYSLNSE